MLLEKLTQKQLQPLKLVSTGHRLSFVLTSEHFLRRLERVLRSRGDWLRVNAIPRAINVAFNARAMRAVNNSGGRN